nr:ParA family protein [Gammaproteobacteria bacterium]
MQTLAFIHQKGGTGKTSLAIVAAITFAAQRKRVLVLDSDYQGTATRWFETVGEAMAAREG